MQKTVALVFFSIVVFLTKSNALEIDSVKEGRCDEDAKAVSTNFDFKWASSAAEKWYFPVLSKLEFYRSVQDLLPNKPLETFTEDDAKKSCFTMKWNKPTEVTVSGFDGKTYEYALVPTGVNTFSLKSEKPNGESDLRGTAYITLTDNRNYLVFVNCWNDGLKSWAVAAIKQKLSEKAKEKIKKHLEGIGFDMEYLYEQSYSGCDESQKGKKEEL